MSTMLLHNMSQPILAADFTQIAITLVLIFFAAMKALFEANKQPAPKWGPVAPPQLPKGPRPPMPNAPQPVGGQQADQLRNQVEEFLRRAGRPPQAAEPKQQVSQPRPTSEIELLVGDVPREPQSRPAIGEKLPSAARSSGPDKQRSGRRSKRRQSVAEHVAEAVAGHVAQSVASRSDSMAQKTSRLGQRILAEDEEFDIKLKAKFDHTLGTLSERTIEVQTTSPSPPVMTPAAQIAAMLANPEGVRQAVILNEILHRPSDRW